METFERIRNHWRRWGLHKARAEAQMWKEIAEEERQKVERLTRHTQNEVVERYTVTPHPAQPGRG